MNFKSGKNNQRMFLKENGSFALGDFLVWLGVLLVSIVGYSFLFGLL
jgi:hypothetical protein